ncbi:MAG: hypothetical protein MK371_02435 [SAR86 cluster bacterium]|jgi:hypothetical protein|nr:hypothetical protein [SAR86 cluster bacterium]HIC27326.1 hypothetical protein [Gammaproteobacteria bacterium]
MKQIILLLTIFSLASSSLAEDVTYKVGDVYQSKKHTSFVLLFHFKQDLFYEMRRSHETVGLSGYREIDSRHTYDLEKGDKIVLLESLKDAKAFRVALVKKKKKKIKESPHYFVQSENFRHLVFTEHLTE